ncbi:MAG: Glucose-6-phosphate 1-dehydrogenase [Syntrophorhabdus sp. PtaU1.Bin153]|nr:MAG: Glucose-6-phosphate 1-dehydrogenase [Syntrophorhabdus sp. PtaU1.Bin153]
MPEFEHDTIIDSRFLQTCDIPEAKPRIEVFTMVIFGGAGDLTRRKLLPSLFHLYKNDELPDGFAVLAFDKLSLDDHAYREAMKEALKTFDEEPVDDDKWDMFAGHVHYMKGFFEDDEKFVQLRRKVFEISRPASKGLPEVIYYMAVPPQVTPRVIEKLKAHNLCREVFNSRVVVEKPFGHDRQSAARLNKILTDAFDENQIYRIDHYLARDPVQNIIFFRFTNTIFEETWNRRYVDNVQITVAEDIGIEHRGTFYEQAGVVRDIVQNHIMQALGLIAMEAPIGFDADFVRDEKLKVLRSIRPLSENYIDRFMVRGQYGPGILGDSEVPGYRQEKDVASSSNTPTFFAGKFQVDNLRWAGVPFYIRTGKRMPKKVTEICIQFKRLPLRLFGRTCDVLEPNILVLTIQPDEKISLKFGVKYPYTNNQIYSANMIFSYREIFKTYLHRPYERVLLDLLLGDLTLFVREDTIEAMWGIVDPIIKRWEELPSKDFPNYAAGTWGPPEARQMVEQEGRSWVTV